MNAIEDKHVYVVVKPNDKLPLDQRATPNPIKMKNKSLPIFAASLALLSFSNIIYAQAPNLRTAANYVLFTSEGALGNTGISQITGDLGTNVGAVSGFGNVDGVIHNADAATIQTVSDLQIAYNYLDTLTYTSTHLPVLGNGEVLTAGVYFMAAAASLEANLILDAQGDPNAVFIFRIGAAFTTAASSTVTLTNGALACNVFWKAGGAISMAASTSMKGTLIANGAVDIGDGGSVEGRMLSIVGAVSVYGTLAYIPLGCGRPMLTGPLAPGVDQVECFALFSSNGGVANSGVTTIIGDVGTNNGSTTGYDPSLVTGTIHLSPDAATAQTATALPGLYNYLDTITHDIELLYPAQFGNKLVLTPHTYRMNAATHLTDTVSLNAQGNADAVFIIQINGALTTAASSNVKLINGTQSKNVYWKVTGAVSMAANSIFNGTIVNNGAINLNTGVTLNGRALTMSGLVTTTAVTVNKPTLCNFILLATKITPITAICDKQNIVLTWSTATETNIEYFTIERNIEGSNWQVISKVAGTGSSSLWHKYSVTDRLPGAGNFYYRLKQTDFSGNVIYGNILSVKKCDIKAAELLTVYPNPSVGKFDLSFTGDRSEILSTQIFNVRGEKVYESNGFQSKFNLSGKTAGMYFLRIQLKTKIINRVIVLEN